MKRAIVLAILVIGVIGGAVFAQCGCNQPPAPAGNKPACYTAVWRGKDVHFKLNVPAEYFFTSPTPPTPLITGWRVERLDGTVVFQDLFPSVPKGAWYEMVWNERNSHCTLVAPGYYRIIISTDSAGVYSTIIKIVAPPPCLVPCGVYPRLVSHPCSAPCGSPYIQVLPQKVAHASLSISISIPIQVNCGGCP